MKMTTESEAKSKNFPYYRTVLGNMGSFFDIQIIPWDESL